MADWYKIPPSLRVTEREYRANVDGINIVFGAVLGFVLAGAEGLPPLDFMTVLFVSATVVVLILYLGSSAYKLFNGIAAAASIAALPYILRDLLKIDTIPALQPTLAVWAVMIVIVELLPRKPETTEEDPSK